MSDMTDIERDDPMIAAEYALGLLEGEELLTARGRMVTDAAFAAAVAEWEDRLAPLLDAVPPMEPSSELWSKIEARVNASAASQAEVELAGGGSNAANVVALEQRVRRWQWTAGLTSAAAAVALAFVALTPSAGPGPNVPDAPLIAAADPLVAQVPIGDTGLRLDVTYVPESDRMLVGAIGLTADGVHDHELWLVPADGSALQSLGVVSPGEVRSTELPDEIARNMGDGVQLVLTREPIGGKPEGEDAGPVVAEGTLSQV